MENPLSKDCLSFLVQDAAIKSFRFVVYLPHHYSSNKKLPRVLRSFLNHHNILLETCNTIYSVLPDFCANSKIDLLFIGIYLDFTNANIISNEANI
jgi:hypothetical protein